jgi:glycosyltransferase involved in cell wall biosynthesis
MPNQTPYLSFVIPVYNEEGNVEQLQQEMVEVGEQLGRPFEIIFVDDGSSDKTPQILKQLKPAKIITFRKNFGQTAAIDAGVHEAQGEFIVTLDGDLQNDPHDVPKMLAYLQENELDVVCGWRKKRQDNEVRKIITAGARFWRKILISDGIHDSGCTLRVYKHECFDGFTIRGEMHRFIPALLRWKGFKIGEIEVNHRGRKSGRSKYSWQRAVKGFLDMLMLWFFHKYEARPLHILGFVGLMMIVLGGGIGTWMFVERYFFRQSIVNRIWPLVSVFLILSGLQMFISGLIMDLIIRNQEGSQFYEIKEIQTQ